MNRNDVLHWLILGFGLSGGESDLGRSTSFLELWKDARETCFDCDRDEMLDALYTLPREHATLFKLVASDEGIHPVGFEKVRNTVGWPEYFTTGEFSVRVLPEGAAHYQKLAEEMEHPRVADFLGLKAKHAAAVSTAVPR